MGYCKGVLYIVLWFASIFAGYAGFFCPLLPLMLISNKLYRRITDLLLTFWQMYPSALLEFIYGCEIHVSGDPINSGENTLLVMNHRTRTDWNFLWPAVYRSTSGRNRWLYPTKFVLKDPIRHIPGVGWMMQLGSYVYIKRHWEEDKKRMSKAIDYFAELSIKFSLLIFPEGTDFTQQTKANSDCFADKAGLPHYEHVLHPRTTGFCFLAKKMLEKKCLDAIYDVTIIYSDPIPQNEACLINGTIPNQICVNFKRYEAEDFGGTDISLQHFLEHRWAEKEEAISSFHARMNLRGEEPAMALRKNRSDLFAALIFWTLLPVPVLYLMITSLTFRYMVVAHTVFLILVNALLGGFQAFEIGVYETKKSIKRRFAHEHDD